MHDTLLCLPERSPRLVILGLELAMLMLHKLQILTLARGLTLCDALGMVQVRREAEELAALNAREAAELAAAPAAATPTDADEEAAEEAVQTHAVSMLHACRSVDAYERLDRISEGTYGIVFR